MSVWTFDSSDGNSTGKWREECELGVRGADQQGVIQDVAWAPAMGRSYHLIATASRENNFKVSDNVYLFIYILILFAHTIQYIYT